MVDVCLDISPLSCYPQQTTFLPIQNLALPFIRKRHDTFPSRHKNYQNGEIFLRSDTKPLKRSFSDAYDDKKSPVLTVLEDIGSPSQQHRHPSMTYDEGSQNASTRSSPPKSLPKVRSSPESLWHYIPREVQDASDILPKFQSPLEAPASPRLPPIGSERLQRQIQQAAVSQRTSPTSSSRGERMHGGLDNQSRIYTECGSSSARPSCLDFNETITASPTSASTSPLQLLLTPITEEEDEVMEDLPKERLSLAAFIELQDLARRKNPYAPRLMSKFNPLRDQAPSQVWKRPSFPLQRHWRYKTTLHELQQFSSRTECDAAAARRPLREYLKGDLDHCRHCQRFDTLVKRLLISRRIQAIHEESTKSYLQYEDEEDEDDWDPDADDDDEVIDISSNGILASLTHDRLPSVPLDGKDIPDSPMIHDLNDFDFEY